MVKVLRYGTSWNTDQVALMSGATTHFMLANVMDDELNIRHSLVSQTPRLTAPSTWTQRKSDTLQVLSRRVASNTDDALYELFTIVAQSSLHLAAYAYAYLNWCPA